MSPMDAIDSIHAFIERGGPVLLVIGGIVFWMWTMILERAIFFAAGFGPMQGEVIRLWEARAERRSWEAHRVRESMVAEARMALNDSLPMIKSLVALCPLMGLLGTVTGMMEVFDVMAAGGGTSARGMAGGISKATIPTMAGMVAALTGVFFVTALERGARRRITHLEDELTFDH